jgi:hypothetical protein
MIRVDAVVVVVHSHVLLNQNGNNVSWCCGKQLAAEEEEEEEEEVVVVVVVVERHGLTYIHINDFHEKLRFVRPHRKPASKPIPPQSRPTFPWLHW